MRKTYFSYAAALAAMLAAVFFVLYRWRTSGFDWALFAFALRRVHLEWLLPAILLILATYVGRALRWEVMLKPLRKDVKLWRIFSSTAIGFTAIVLFGRAGEPVRPYLIARRENVSFSSQVGVWIVERIFDLLMVLLIFGVAMTQISKSSIHPGKKLQVVMEAGGYAVGILGAGSLGLLIALRQFRGSALQRFLDRFKFIPGTVRLKLESTLSSFEEGMESMRRAHLVLLLLGYTILEWVGVIVAFSCTCRAFPATENFSFADSVILLGFVAFGSAVQLPGIGGGLQVAAVVVLTEFFNVPLEAASGIAMVLWGITFVIIVPLGLILAFHAGIKWRNLWHLDSSIAGRAGTIVRSDGPPGSSPAANPEEKSL